MYQNTSEREREEPEHRPEHFPAFKIDDVSEHIPDLKLGIRTQSRTCPSLYDTGCIRTHTKLEAWHQNTVQNISQPL